MSDLVYLDKLEAAARAATPGKWRHYKAKLRPGCSTIVNEVQPVSGEPIVRWSGFDGMSKSKTAVAADARFIAAANPAVVLGLIADLRAALQAQQGMVERQAYDALARERDEYKRRAEASEQAQQGDALDANLYYLQDSRDYVGNDMLFHAKKGMGYVTDLRKAEVFTKADAVAAHERRSTDIPWPKEYIDGKTRPAVDMQYVKRDEALAGTGIVLIVPKKYRKTVERCWQCGGFISQEQVYTECPKCHAENRP